MSDRTRIEWTDATWNPIVGCSVVSPGCTNCYAMRMAGGRLRNHPSRQGLTVPSKAGPVWNGEVRLIEGALDQPLRWARRRRIFVCAHGDLFHENVPDEWIDRVFAVMALAPRHSFQVLTKRPERMRSYMLEQWQGTLAQNVLGEGIAAGRPTGRREQIAEACEPFLDQLGLVDETNDSLWAADGSCLAMKWKWHLPNVWLGVSVEDQLRADERIPLLLDTPAAVRFVSAEPLLGPVDLTKYMHDSDCAFASIGRIEPCTCSEPREVGLDWVIVGGESGPGARPMHPDWARSLRDQCAAARVPFFFKQHGEWIWAPESMNFAEAAAWAGGRRFEHHSNGGTAVRIGKKVAGRVLDSRLHDAMPSPARAIARAREVARR